MVLYCGDFQDKTPAWDSVPGQDIWWWYKELDKAYAGVKGPAGSNDVVFRCAKDRGCTTTRPRACRRSLTTRMPARASRPFPTDMTGRMRRTSSTRVYDRV